MALTESPPPTTVYAWSLRLPTAAATALVPAANFSNSNTPIGPFQKTIFAPFNASA